MCGINGMVFMNNVVRSENDLRAIRFIFDALLVETQKRGHHATGLTVFERNGKFDLHKAAVPAELMTTYDDDYDKIVENIDDKDSIVLSHTRWYTKGKPDNNNNNHPFDIGNVVGVHNGTIANDDHLFTLNKDNFARIAEVDSEIAYQLINFHNKDAITYEGLQNALEKTYLRGMFALAFVHKNQPNLLHIVKQERPMDIYFWKEVGVVIFNSDKKYIDNAFDSLRRVGKRFGITNTATLAEFKLAEDKYITIDANGSTFEEMMGEPQNLFLISTAKTTYSSTTTNANNGTTATHFTRVTASDSVGRIIEGELDTVSGEVILFTRVSQVGEDDDGANMNEDDEAIFCIECEIELEEHEIHAAYNEGASHTDSYHCYDCNQKALTGIFAGSI